MTSVTDYLLQLQSLTKTNLEILQAINKSFTTQQQHLAVEVSGSTYAIPSFISLENKVNALQENFENLVHAPLTGEACFNFDGDSRAIEVRSYTHVPHRLKLNNVKNFKINNNDIFKDFLTPVPYVNFDIPNLPNDITSVNVKKIIPLTNELKDKFKSLLGEDVSVQANYSDIYKIISIYDEDVDYIAYDSTKKLPIRKNIGTGTYVIEKIVSDTVDVDLDEYIVLKFRNDLNDYTKDLTYKAFDETISKNLKIGDELVTFDGSAKMVITDIFTTNNSIEVKLMHGEYLNLVESGSDDNISDYSKLRFYSPVDFDKDKYVQVPLEEDSIVFIAIAPLNDRMNVQGPWGTGVLLNTDLLVDESTGVKFNKYYNENVRNIGDILFEITSMMSNTLTKYSKDDYEKMSNAVPELNPEHIKVMHINKHLNDSATVQNIRSLYSQKKSYEVSLREVQEKIDSVNQRLASISYDDTSNLRATYTAQLSEYNTKKNELITSITKTIDAISISVNNSEVPIENAKYRIRGFFDPIEFANNIGIDHSHICGIQVQYRYKNVNQEQGTAVSMGTSSNGDRLFVFSDWNIMNSFINPRTATWDGSYKFSPATYNGNINEPSYNQIDIPISQGETVDIRLKVIYDFGRPFVEVTSGWSEIMNIKFPDEFLKDVQILDIISENNNDIETNRFRNIIIEHGIPNHIDDKVIDQDITYYHKPESIASGFYTAERRIIPLKDKLSEINTSVQQLKDEVMGSSADNIVVSIVNGDAVNILQPYQVNNITVEGYGEIKANADKLNGSYVYEDNVVSTILNIVLSNRSEHTMKIYSVFPGDRDKDIHELIHTKFEKSDYSINSEEGVWIYCQDGQHHLQKGNQIITFRINDAYNGEPYYGENGLDLTNKVSDAKPGLTMYPFIANKYSISLDSSAVRSYITIAPGAEIVIPIMVKYNMSSKTIDTKTMSFDIRTSLYQDLINYTFSVTAKNVNNTQDKLISTVRRSYGVKDVNNNGWVKYKSVDIK